MVFVAIQLFVPGSYLPPVFNRTKFWSVPPQIIISLPLQTALCEARAEGTLAMVVAIQLFVLGLYVPPVLKYWGGGPSLSFPPQTIISLPVHTAVCNTRAAGALVVLVATHCRYWDCISHLYLTGGRCYYFRPRRSFHCQSTLRCDPPGL